MILINHPPAAVRLFARRKKSPKSKQIEVLTLQEIAISSGLPMVRVKAISQMVTWDTVTIPEAERFCAGCQFDPLNPADRNRKSAYTRSCQKKSTPPYSYLRKSPLWLTEFVPLIRRLQSQKRSSVPAQ